MDRYLIKYLKDTADNALMEKYLDYFKVTLDQFIYDYGDHVYSTHQKIQFLKIFSGLKRSINVLFGSIKQYSDKQNVLSSVSSLANNNILFNLGFNPISSILEPVGNSQILGNSDIINLIKNKRKYLFNGTFNNIFNQFFFAKWEEIKTKIVKDYQNYDFRALFLNTDENFESKYLIEIFRILDRPSMIFSHGLPGIYSAEIDNRSDFLMVWGDKIKQNYINVGFNSDKIFVVGNPKYQSYTKERVLKNTIEHILVVPPASFLFHQHTFGEPILMDRSMGILYLYKVQKVLENLGITHARFRPHPSIAKEWIYGFLDQKFYKMDEDKLKDSCLKSTLIIGATSTVFLEALMFGVNYIVFEPKFRDGKNILRCDLVPPFDCSEANLEIATSEEELEYLIRNKYLVDIKILDEYMKPLDLSILKKIIKC